MLKQRIITGIFLFLFLFFLIFLFSIIEIAQTTKQNLLILLGFFFIVLSNKEIFTMFEKEKKIKLNHKIFILILSIIVFLFSLLGWLNNDTNISNQKNSIIQCLSIFFLFIILLLLIFFVIYDNFTAKDLGINFIIIFYISIGTSSFLSFFINNKIFFWYIILITVLTDIFSFLTGSLFGKKKIFPNISPNKTLEGYIYGSILSTFIVCSIFFVYYKKIFFITTYKIINIYFFIIFTFFNSIMAQIGDLINSKFKRNYNIKDFGKLLPGHGGLLDRFDSLLFISLFINFIFQLNIFTFNNINN
ncbi:phosphatidate cytidylyltransferase [Candidatus Phytoplasma prunorum]|uniref:phosphatidate cytidylyltransferase n=1 Tax=Candidatus Phytoplasma prunorum TaxID=47565 RepID=UPI002FF3FB6A